MKTVTLNEHLTWAKERALELLGQGDLQQAFMSMISDLGKHPGTKGHPMIRLGTDLYLGKHLDSSIEIRKFIEGF
jgi:hypothetical protein